MFSKKNICNSAQMINGMWNLARVEFHKHVYICIVEYIKKNVRLARWILSDRMDAESA